MVVGFSGFGNIAFGVAATADTFKLEVAGKGDASVISDISEDNVGGISAFPSFNLPSALSGAAPGPALEAIANM